MSTNTFSCRKRSTAGALAFVLLVTTLLAVLPSGVFAGSQQTADVRLFAAQDYESFAVGDKNYYTTYNSYGIHGNGSGREVSSAHAHAGGGADAAGTGRAVRLTMNQTRDTNVAQLAVIDAEKNTPAVTTGENYLLSFWAYLDDAAQQEITYHVHTARNVDSLTVGFHCETEKTITMPAGSWQYITLPVENVAADDPTGSWYLTIGATFAGASTSNIRYLFVDDVEVRTYTAQAALQDMELYADGQELALSTTHGTAQISRERNHTPGGLQSVRVTATTSAGGIRPQMVLRQADGTPMRVEQGGNYTLSFWVYCPAEATDRQFRYWLCATDSAEAFADTTAKNAALVYEGADIPVLQAGWTQIVAEIEDCAHAGTLRLGVTSPSAAVATPAMFYLDDFTLTRQADRIDYETAETVTNLGESGRAELSTAQNHTPGGSKSVKLTSYTYNGWGRAQIMLQQADGQYLQPERQKDYQLSFYVYVPSGQTGELRFWICATEADAVFQASTEKNACVLYEMNSGDVPVRDAWYQYTVPLSSACWKDGGSYGPYLRLGVTSSSVSSTGFTCYVDDVVLRELCTPATTENYETFAVGANAVQGNGSGREISAAHAHAGNGADTQQGRAVRLKMNQAGTGNYARTVIFSAGQAASFRIGARYAVSFWCYWDPAENSVEDTRTETSLRITAAVGSVDNPQQVFGSHVNGAEGSAQAVLGAGQWQRVTVVTQPIAGVNGGETTNLTLGALFSGASEDNMKYLYVDDVSVVPFGQWNGEGLADAVSAGNGGLLYMDGASAVYWSESRGEACTAVRLVGEFTALAGDRTVAVGAGSGWSIRERGILLGDAGTLPEQLVCGNEQVQCIRTTGVGLQNCWSYDAASGRVTYTALVKNITQTQKDTLLRYRAYLVLDVGGTAITVYSGVCSFSAQQLYSRYCSTTGETPTWFEGAAPGESGDTLSLLDGLDSRFRVVYPTGDTVGQIIAEKLQTALQELLGEFQPVDCVSDEQPDNGGYEILIGNTNRTEDDAAAAWLAAKDAKYNAAFLVRMNGKKLLLQAKDTDDDVKYAYALELAADWLVETCREDLCISRTLDYYSAAASEASAGAPLLQVDATGNNLLNNAQIIVERYPSYMALTAAKELQRAIAQLSGQYIAIVKYDGSVEHTTGVSLIVGPKQGAVKAVYATEEPAPAAATTGAGNDDDTFSLETHKPGQVISAGGNGLLTDVGTDGYRISVTGHWPDWNVQVNGGSPAAINAGVQELIAGLQATGSSGATRTGANTGDHALSDGYGVAFFDEFEYTSAEEIQQRWTIDGGGAGQGCTIVTEAYAAAGYDPAVFGYTPYGPDENGDYWDWQSRPAIWGTDGTYYAQGGYLYEYTRKAQDGYWAVRATGQGKVNYRYGFTEVRMIAATDYGACSSIWLVSRGTPHAEIDVYENFGQDKLVCNLHYWDSGVHTSLDASADRYRSAKRTYRMEDGSHFYDTFHHIGYEWDAQSITFYVDGEAYLTVDTTVSDTEMTAAQMDVFRQDCWIKITNGISAGSYTGRKGVSSHDPADYAPGGYLYGSVSGRTDGKYVMESTEDFLEVQVVDSLYIYQKNDGQSYVETAW